MKSAFVDYYFTQRMAGDFHFKLINRIRRACAHCTNQSEAEKVAMRKYCEITGISGTNDPYVWQFIRQILNPLPR